MNSSSQSRLMAFLCVLTLGTSLIGCSLPVVYDLKSGSMYHEGCVDPCLCPVASNEVHGTFSLIQLSPTPLFTRYSVTDISWTVVNSSGGVVHKITGQGTYQIGGEVAVTQQLTLDLSIDGGTTITLDSGLVPEQSAFPNILITVNEGLKCTDIWIDINASPK